MMKTNRLIYYLFNWVFKDPKQPRQFENVVELHYFLSGYQMSESNNSLNKGDGFWISNFMIYCDTFLDEKLKQNSEYKSGNIYYKKIQLLQMDEKDGLKIFCSILHQFVEGFENNQNMKPK